MDLNDLLYRHQVSLMRASAAGCVSAKASHRGLARGYATRISDLQSRLGAQAAAPMAR